MEIVKIVALVAIVAALVGGLIWWGTHQGQSTTVATGPNGSPGQASVTLPKPFESQINVVCQDNGKAPVAHITEQASNVDNTEIRFEPAGSKNCGPANACKQETWHMFARETYHLDLDPEKSPHQGNTNDLGSIECMCVCPPTSSSCSNVDNTPCPPNNPNCHVGVCRH
jgi:hypothetical protein